MTGTVEADETFIGGEGPQHAQAQTRTQVSRSRAGWKSIVFGLLERETGRFAFPTLNTRRKEHLHEHVRENVAQAAE